MYRQLCRALSTMTSKHLTSADELPALNKDVLHLYNMQYCPYAHRTRLVLKYKDIPHQTVNINLADRPTWFEAKTIVGKVPSIEVNGKIIFDSIITSDYLDEAYPEKKLHPCDPLQKALDRNVLDILGTRVLGPFFSMLKTGGDNDTIFSGLEAGMNKIEEDLKKRGSPYFGGSAPGMLDYMMWTCFERLPILQTLVDEKYLLPSNKTPSIMEWVKRMMEDPVVKSEYISVEAYTKVYKGFATGKFEYE